MENEDSQEITLHNFLKDKKVTAIFGKVDYLLKSGVHIQRNYPLPGELYRFIERNEDSLRLYYKELFKVTLEKSGTEFNGYYFIDFEDGSRGGIPSEQRDYLKTEYIIIGMLFLKLVKFDGNVDLNKVSDFTSLLFSEYEEEKVALRKLIADASSDKGSDFTDTRLMEVISKAFGKFNELGWISWEEEQEKDSFHEQPSFARLRNLYEPQILGIDKLIQSLKDVK